MRLFTVCVTTGGKNESYCNAIDEDSTVKKKRRKEGKNSQRQLRDRVEVVCTQERLVVT